jgi:hypothetical protein
LKTHPKLRPLEDDLDVAVSLQSKNKGLFAKNCTKQIAFLLKMIIVHFESTLFYQQIVEKKIIYCNNDSCEAFARAMA